MWIPAGVLYAIAGLALIAGWLREAEVRTNKQDRSWARTWVDDRKLFG